MTISNIKTVIPGELHKVWDVVLDIENYAVWRSDLSKTEVISDKQFIEYTKDGYRVGLPSFSSRYTGRLGALCGLRITLSPCSIQSRSETSRRRCISALE